MYGLNQVNVIGKGDDKQAGRYGDLHSVVIDFIKEHKPDGSTSTCGGGGGTHFPVDTAVELAAEFKGTKVNRTDFAPTMQHKFDECLQISGKLDESMRQYLSDVA